MRKLIVAIILAALIGAGIFYYLQQTASADSPSIRISGNIEITSVNVSFKIAGRVEQRLVDEGDRVEQGQLIAVLDSVDLEHEVDLREAARQAAQANLAELQAGYLPEEIGQAQERVQQAEADLRKLEVDFRRQKQLFGQGVVSARDYDNSRAAYEVAQAKHKEALQQLTLLQKGTRQEKIDQAAAQLKQAEQSLVIARVNLSYAHLYSPLSGMVLSKNIEPGEYVSPGTPIVTIGDLDHLWMRGYINETDLGKVKLGQKVAVTADTYPNKTYDGTIVFISPEAEFTPKNIQTEKERVKLVYRIKVDIDNFQHELKPGMPVDGMILLE